MLAALRVVPLDARPFAGLVCYSSDVANGAQLMLETEPLPDVLSGMRHLRVAA